MQRQSLGSPANKQHHCAAAAASPNAEEGDDDRQRRRWSGSSSLRVGVGGGAFQADEQGVVAPEDEAKKPGRPVRYSDRRSVHLIPVLVLLCFLVLYLFSHDPADPKGAAGFGDLDGGLDAKGAAERRYMVAAKMRSQRRLKEVEKLRGGRGRKLWGGGGRL